MTDAVRNGKIIQKATAVGCRAIYHVCTNAIKQPHKTDREGLAVRGVVKLSISLHTEDDIGKLAGHCRAPAKANNVDHSVI